MSLFVVPSEAEGPFFCFDEKQVPPLRRAERGSGRDDGDA
jgi:hypothetical protein